MPQKPAISGSALFDKLRAEYEAASVLQSEWVREAMRMAEELYGDRPHWTGVSLLEHVTGVLRVLMQFSPDEEAVVGCLLHHVLEIKEMTLNELEARFDETVRSIVSGVHLLSHVTIRDRRMSIENLRLMFQRVSDDIRIVLIILCEQVFVSDHLAALRPEERRRACRDILDLFSPAAARLGIYSLKHQLELRAFPVLYPTDATRIEEQLGQVHAQSGDFLSSASEQLQMLLAAEGIKARVEGREKQPYSIFGKMSDKGITHISDLYDLFALRVVVQTAGDCYQVLGHLHRIGHPVPNRFKDYIAFPKPNGYQSLHTTMTKLPGVPEGFFVEVQIRTEQMHREAEYGVAAHWSYKQGGGAEHIMQRVHLQNILAFQEDDTERGAVDYIFVLTPKGDILELPEGATPLDFAFSVHTQVGLSFKAARVNGSIVPLDYPLENGDVVEIIRHHEPRPSPQWMLHLRTASAKSRLKQYLGVRERPVLIDQGRDLLNVQLREMRLPPLDQDLTVLRNVGGSPLSHAEREDLLVKLAQNALKVGTLLHRLDALQDRFAASARKPAIAVTQPRAAIEMDGDLPMPIHFAKCCKPDEGKRGPILGIIRAGAVRIHRTHCKTWKGVNPGRRVKVWWK